MKVVLTYNTGSGDHASLKELKQLFSDASIEIIDHIKVTQGFEAKLKPHIANKTIIAVVGGDGTMSNVANLIKDTGATLMPIPGGTLNHFTKDLGVPQSIPDALQYFKSAKTTKIDVGQIDGKQYSTPLVFVGNNKYTLHGLSFQRSSLTDGVLSVYVVRGKSRLNLFFAFLSLLRGQKNMPKKLKSFTTKEVTITTKHTLRVSRDGEYEKLPSPLRYKVQKSSVSILQQQ